MTNELQRIESRHSQSLEVAGGTWTRRSCTYEAANRGFAHMLEEWFLNLIIILILQWGGTRINILYCAFIMIYRHYCSNSSYAVLYNAIHDSTGASRLHYFHEQAWICYHHYWHCWYEDVDMMLQSSHITIDYTVVILLYGLHALYMHANDSDGVEV